MKKQWISIKCGLSRDPKHRRAMANSIWLFMHMLDLADWDTGIIVDWRDEAEAEEMGMELRTLREQRRELDQLGYITCKQKQRGQSIVIHNWTNPREYTGEIYNQKQGDNKTSPKKQQIQGYVQGYAQGSIKNVTPTSSPNTKESINDDDESARAKKSKVAQAYENEIGALTPMIADALRDAEHDFPEDWIVEALHIAVERNVRNWRFVLAILNDCKAKNIRPSLNRLEAKNGNTSRNSGNAAEGKTSARAGRKTNGDSSGGRVEEKDVAKLAEINRRRKLKREHAAAV
jgi:DnaD/phage-associated family protein